jgi:YkoY family integral membrane protein
MFGQTFTPGDLATIALLVLLEGLLSIDNALVLGILSQRVDPDRRSKALSYGLIGALVLRILAVAAAAFLLRFSWLKLVGGLYLIWAGLEHFLRAPKKRKLPPEARRLASLHWVILQIELTDLAFAVDSILAAFALVGGPPPGFGSLHPKLWLVITGGMLGVILMRFAAAIFARLLDRFPHLQTSGFVLVMLIGGKLVLDWSFNTPQHPDRLDFNDYHAPALYIFWGLMLVILAMGTLAPGRRKK